MKKKKAIHSISIAKNAVKDAGDGVVVFNKPLTITDNSLQRNGTRYDIKSMDVSEYDGNLTVDHSMSVKDIVGETFGLNKGTKKVTIDGIRFAVQENALARYTYNMLLGGFIKDFSIETIGPWPDEEGIYKDSQLIGLSAVVKGNNKSASVNKVVVNSIEEARKDGLDTSSLDLLVDNSENNHDNEDNMSFVTIKNTRDFEVKVVYKNAAGDEVEKTLQSGETVDVSKEQEKSLLKQINDAVAPKKEEEETKVDFQKVLENALSPLTKKIEELEQQAFDKTVKEPEFKKSNKTNNKINELRDMHWRQRHGAQINYAWDMLVKNDTDAGKKLREINEIHVEKLVEEDIVPNTVTTSDFGNFVISPELLREIEGHRSNFQPLLSRLEYRETLSLEMAWLKRSGDVDMQEVEMEADGADGELKPISEYSATINRANLHELAAVTPVANAATRFLAADLLSDVAAGYRTDYDRKRAQLFIVRLQQAVDNTGQKVTYSGASAADRLTSWVDMWSEITEEVENGVFVMSYKTRGKLIRDAIRAGVSGPLVMAMNSGDFQPILGADAIVVPNELLPTLDTAETKSFTVEGTSVTINQSVFYVDPNTFSGRTSGGLNYDLSTEAAYEQGGSVKSAFQRNELVLRGSFFRNGAVRDEDRVASMSAAGVS